MTRYVYTRYTPIREATCYKYRQEERGPKGREWAFLIKERLQKHTKKYEGYKLVDGKFAGYWIQYL